MAIDEASRLHLYEQARASWGADAADTLMNAIPADSDRLATKDDLAVLGSDVRAETAEVRAEMHASIASQTRTIVFAMIAGNATLVGLVLAAVRLG
jgi:hypothetical protein